MITVGFQTPRMGLGQARLILVAKVLASFALYALPASAQTCPATPSIPATIANLQTWVNIFGVDDAIYSDTGWISNPTPISSAGYDGTASASVGIQPNLSVTATAFAGPYTAPSGGFYSQAYLYSQAELGYSFVVSGPANVTVPVTVSGVTTNSFSGTNPNGEYNYICAYADVAAGELCATPKSPQGGFITCSAVSPTGKFVVKVQVPSNTVNCLQLASLSQTAGGGLTIGAGNTWEYTSSETVTATVNAALPQIDRSFPEIGEFSINLPLQVTSMSLPSAVSGQTYTPVTLKAEGGSDCGYVWSVSSGSLPPGFELSSGGALSSMGSPTAPAGSYNFTVQVTDSTGNIATQLLTLFINGLIAPQISPTTIPGATSGQPYSQALSASGGSGTGYIWSLGSGFLPIGFAFTSSGVLSSTGIPAAPAGSYAFTVQVTDSAGNIGSQLYTLVVQRPRGTITLLDPVPTLLASSSGSPIISTSTAMASLAPSARVVQGVASDGVTQVVIDISNALPNENLSLTVSGDGGLAALGSSAFQPSSLTFPADAQGNAFALYQAPVDFDDGVDSVRASRNVSLHLASIDDPTFTADSQITIVRPLVMLIPGLWSKNHQTWNRFTPLVNNSMFEVVEGDYDTGGFVVSASDPYYPPWLLNANLRGSALSLSYSTPIVLQQLQIWLQSFRNGANPVGLPVAAIQADIVGHSMGGLVARNMVLQPGYLSPKNYGTGLIHKLITIDTPHLGTPLAGDLLDDANECVSSLLALGGDIALNKVSTQFGQIGGAVADLEGDGGGNALSPAIQALGNSNGTPIPVAMIAAETNVANLSSISFGGATILIATDCLFPNDPSISDPLAISLNPGSWNNVFKSSGDPTGNNDGVVGLYSQLDGLSPDPNLLFNGYIHDFGLEGLTSLGFSGPSVIDAGAVPSQVIDLLNTSKLDTTHYYQLAP